MPLPRFDQIGEHKENAVYFSVISLLAHEISKHADYMARWCYACPDKISPERRESMRNEIDVLLPSLGRAANMFGIVRADSPIYDPIRGGDSATRNNLGII